MPFTTKTTICAGLYSEALYRNYRQPTKMMVLVVERRANWMFLLLRRESAGTACVPGITQLPAGVAGVLSGYVADMGVSKNQGH